MGRFCQVGELMARGQLPQEIQQVVRMGRMTALKKTTGVRGIVAGDIVRRLVAKTISHHLRVQVEKATAPFQCALSTRAGCECIAHALQAVTDADPEATILSVDGISAYDSISRVAMIRGGFRQMEGSDALLPFVNQFHGSHSTYLWEDDEGVVHEVLQGEGRE